jgi:hypothetical protein
MSSIRSIFFVTFTQRQKIYISNNGTRFSGDLSVGIPLYSFLLPGESVLFISSEMYSVVPRSVKYTVLNIIC